MAFRPHVVLLVVLSALVLSGCLIMPLPPPTEDNGSSGGGGGGTQIPQPPSNSPSGPSSFLFSNQSSHNLQLSYQIDAGSSQTAVVNAGQSQTISNVPHCSCFTVNNITPTQEGFSVELCSSGEADIKNDPLNPFGGLTTTLSGGGPSSGVVTFTIQNLSTHALTIFPYVNGQVRS